MNPMDFLKIRQLLGAFSSNHPKFFPFMRAVAQAGAREGTIVEMTVTTPEGQKLETNLRLSDTDLELIRMMREMAGHGDGAAPQAPEKNED
ncbi:MAG: hypothetical protein IJ600_08435 [Lachnospiraceae bacterium]|nr:hypothetical protein [Lachnospiraceae bacterium]